MAQIVGPPANVIRNRPITTELRELLNGAADATGVQKVVIVSGGQTSNHTANLEGVVGGWTGVAPARQRRGGRHRTRQGRKHAKLHGYERIAGCGIRDSRRGRGATGIGAGVNYMGSKRIHVGFGTRPPICKSWSGAPRAHPRTRRPGCEQPPRQGGTIRSQTVLPRPFRFQPPGARSSRHAADCGCARGRGSGSIARDCSTREQGLRSWASTANGRALIWKAMAASMGMCLRHFSEPRTWATPLTASRNRSGRRLWLSLPRREGAAGARAQRGARPPQAARRRSK